LVTAFHRDQGGDLAIGMVRPTPVGRAISP